MQELLSKMRCAMQRYEMVKEGDCIAVGVSGGKDSLVLLAALGELRRFYPVSFTLKAVTLDPCFQNEQADYTAIERLCARLDIPYQVRRSELYHIIFETRKEKNPCSLCARMRRGMLHDAAKAMGCNRIALGHHMDDAAETLLMNLFNGGNLSSFSPVSYLSRKDLYLIRPMVYARESDVARVARKLDLPVQKSSCPADGNTNRQHMKELLRTLDARYGALCEKIVGGLERGLIGGWHGPLDENGAAEQKI